MSDVSDFESRRNALITDITAAFDGVSRGDGTTLHEAMAIDDREPPEEQRAARRLDLEGRWQDVPDCDIFECCSALSFLDESGFRYYIPAFMIYGLRHWGKDESFILDSCEFHLLHEYPKSLRKSDPASIARRNQFTAAQSEAVARFLRFIIEFDEMKADRATAEAVGRWEQYARDSNNGGI